MAHQDDMNWLRKEKLIVRLQGKEFILYAGLLALAHKHGLQSIDTEMVQPALNDVGMYIFRAKVSGERGTYTAYGDASTGNVGKMIVPHILRMAETRAVARALRSYTAVGMCSLEELGGGTEEAKPAPAPKRKPRAKKAAAPKPEPKPEPKAEEPAAPSTEAMGETQPAGKNGKHPSWAGEYKSFIVQVNELGWSYDEVAKMAQEDGHLRPSQMDTAQRRTLLNYLEDKVNRRWDGE